MVKDGGVSPTTLASGLNRPMAIAITSTHVFIAESGTDANAFNDGIISRIPVAGGSKDVLKQGQGAPYSIAAQAALLLWTNFGGQTVVSIPIPAPGQQADTSVLLASMQSGAKGVVADASYVYWLSNGAVLKVKLP